MRIDPLHAREDYYIMPYNILVVDDDSSVREMVCEVLRDDGFAVAAAPDGETAIEMGRLQPFGLVFCDVKMGKTSGF